LLLILCNNCHIFQFSWVIPNIAWHLFYIASYCHFHASIIDWGRQKVWWVYLYNIRSVMRSLNDKQIMKKVISKVFYQLIWLKRMTKQKKCGHHFFIMFLWPEAVQWRVIFFKAPISGLVKKILLIPYFDSTLCHFLSQSSLYRVYQEFIQYPY